MITMPFPFKEINHLEVYLKCKKPSPEDLVTIIRESKLLSGEYYSRVVVKTMIGSLSIENDLRGCIIDFPCNDANRYKLAVTKDADIKVAEWISMEWEHLSWDDFHYSSPAEYAGNDPQTLDELCVYYRHLRRNNIWSLTVKRLVVRRFLDLIFEEADSFARKLSLPFHSLHLLSSLGGDAASTDGSGKITYNTCILYHDADSIRQTIVHELCHSISSGHKKDFSKAMEDAMLILGLIPRPCAYSNKIHNLYGARFPMGNTSPGYDFVDVDAEGNIGNFILDKTSVWKRRDY